MATSDVTSTGSKGRKRGGPLRIDRSRIIDVAKGFDPQTLTMQAVADELGVDRKALNYHVTDRDNLLRLVAESAFESTFASVFNAELPDPDGADWKAALHAWSVAVRDSLVATGIMTYHVNNENLAVFEPVETVLRRLHEAGFDEVTAGRAVIAATRFPMGVGRDILMQRQFGQHPQSLQIKHLLEEDALGGFEGIRGLASADLNSPEDIGNQFEFEFELMIRGLERYIPA